MFTIICRPKGRASDKSSYQLNSIPTVEKTTKSSKAKAAKTTPATFEQLVIQLYLVTDRVTGQPKSLPVKDVKSKSFGQPRYCYGITAEMYKLGGLVDTFMSEFDPSAEPTKDGKYFVWRTHDPKNGRYAFTGNSPMLVRQQGENGPVWRQDTTIEQAKAELKAEAPEAYKEMALSDYKDKIRAAQARFQQAFKAAGEKAPVEADAKPVKAKAPVAKKKPAAKKVADKPDIDQF